MLVNRPSILHAYHALILLNYVYAYIGGPARLTRDPAESWTRVTGGRGAGFVNALACPGYTPRVDGFTLFKRHLSAHYVVTL